MMSMVYKTEAIAWRIQSTSPTLLVGWIERIGWFLYQWTVSDGYGGKLSSGCCEKRDGAEWTLIQEWNRVKLEAEAAMNHE